MQEALNCNVAERGTGKGLCRKEGHSERARKKETRSGKGSALGPQDKINNLHIFGRTVYYISAEYTYNMSTI